MSNEVANRLTAPSASPTRYEPARVVNKSDADIPEAERRRMKDAAEEFEAVFIGQMLKHAGLEEAFGPEASSFSHVILSEIALDVAGGYDFGIAEEAYEVMVARYKGGPRQ
ncbi:MAG: hypothetical protein AAFX08_03605 [Pseudomonadota bacterium]